jgi:hypothetical protein
MRALVVGLLGVEAAAVAVVALVWVLGGAGPAGTTGTGRLLVVLALVVDAAALALVAVAVRRRWRGAEWWAVLVVLANLATTLTDVLGGAGPALFVPLILTAALLVALIPSGRGGVPPGIDES